jgi:hypothetical protein
MTNLLREKRRLNSPFKELEIPQISLDFSQRFFYSLQSVYISREGHYTCPTKTFIVYVHDKFLSF